MSSKASKNLSLIAADVRPLLLQYDALDFDACQIRLLTLNPGRWDEEISCNLATVSLDDRPIYQTLSYVWGTSTIQKDILVKGCLFAVTVNLEAALRRLRRPKVALQIWVDAVCINQEDFAERSTQVYLMRRIYKECQEVQIWLGEEGDVPLETRSRDSNPLSHVHLEQVLKFQKYIDATNIRRVVPFKSNVSSRSPGSSLDIPSALKLLYLLAEDKHLYEMPFFTIETFPEFSLCPTWYNAYHSLINIMSRSWMTRTWTVQEAILPPQATMHIGSFRFPQEILLDAEKNFDHHWYSDCCESVRGLLSDYQSDIDLLNAFEPTGQLRKAQSVYLRNEDPHSWEAHSSHLFLSRSRLTTNPLDCIYGMLGVLPGILPEGTLVDYELDVATLFSRATKQLLASNQSLEMLEYTNNQPTNRHQLPSWTSNWNEDWDSPLQSHYHACGPFKTYDPISPISNDKVLTIEGTRVAVIEHNLSSWQNTHDIEDLRNTLAQWQDMAYNKAKVNEDAFWRTVHFDRPVVEQAGENRTIPNKEDSAKDDDSTEDDNPTAVRAWWQFSKNETMQEDDLLAIKSWWQWFLDPEVTGHIDDLLSFPKRSHSQCWSAILNHFNDQRAGDGNSRTEGCFFTAGPGLIGVASFHLEKGDTIFVCKGAPSPMILRPYVGDLPDGVGAEHAVRCWIFSGFAYVYGMMEGAAVEGEAEWETLHLC